MGTEMPKPQDKYAWYRDLNGYQWLVLLVCSFSWMFDLMAQQLFSLARKPAIRELMGGQVCGAAERTLDGEDRCGTWVGRERGRGLRAQRLPGWESAGSVAGSGADRIAEVEGGGADQQIRKRNRATELPGIRVNLRGKLGHLRGERFYRDRRENGIEVLAPLPGLLRGLSAMQAVFQFDHGNGREHDFGLAAL